ncbi:hypothetical protein Dimus_013371, partial [Dionaea muscipula]
GWWLGSYAELCRSDGSVADSAGVSSFLVSAGLPSWLAKQGSLWIGISSEEYLEDR